VSAVVVGSEQLKRRLSALKNDRMRAAVLRKVVIAAQGEAQALVPRKTGALQRSIKPGRVDARRAELIAGMDYAAYIERGTGIYGPFARPIVPRTKRILAWRTDSTPPAGLLRLSGRSRERRGKQLAGWAFARKVRGRPATPYLVPGAIAALRKGGFDDVVATTWNDAA
jgi:hypothetical protein